jgi:hypothetical protein
MTPPSPTTRRSFFGLAGGTALLCTIGGQDVAVDGPKSLARADAAAARVQRPRRFAAAEDVPQIQPQPGGIRREYWIQAETRNWEITPFKRDEWHNRKLSSRNSYRAFMYREMTAGFADYVRPPTLPGPTLFAEVGDVLVVHFRNADTKLRQAVTMHPHGVKYNPEYDGAYMGEFTRAGGFIAPGETFTYQWECTPDSVGVWPYHDHGPNHTLNTFRGLFGAIMPVRARAAAADHGPRREPAVLQRPRVRRQHADAALARRRGRRDQRHRHGLELPHVPHPRPPLEGCGGGLRRQPGDGAQRVGHGPLRRGQPGSLALPLPRLHPSEHGDGGLVRGRAVREGEVTIRTSLRLAPAALLAVALLVPAGASAQTYPAPKDPGKVQPKPKGPHHTLTVCHKKHACDFRTIQKAVNKAKAGDTVRVRNGTYREAVTISGKNKRYLRLVGNPKHPRKVVLRAKGNMQNGVFVNDADQVTIEGFYARGYKGNGFFVTNANGYTMDHLVARQTGVYGLYAFNTVGGTMRNSEAYYVNDGAFYIGQTPPQDKPKQTIVKNVSGWGSPIGFSATNMRYVTITKSRFYNNAAGIVPNALDSEKFPPPERNVIVDNDIFWNNFNFHEGHPPFKVNDHALVSTLVPIGTGIVLIGGRQNRVENNRIFGNYLGGIGALDSFLLQKNPDAASFDGNIVKGNEFGRGGTDTNGYDIVYAGQGSDNCFTVAPTDTVLNPSTISTCSGKNAFDQPTYDKMLTWAGASAVNGWRQPLGHPAFKGFKALEVYNP